MPRENALEKLTLWKAINDLGWAFLLFATVVGAPSVLQIGQYAFPTFRLTPYFQWVVDGWHQITDLMAAMLEPSIQPAIDWLNRLLDLNVVLNPVWRPLFALSIAFVASLVRSSVRDRDYLLAVLLLAIGCLGSLLGSVLAGLTANIGGWFAQGLVAGLPILCVGLLLSAGAEIQTLTLGFMASLEGYLLALGVGCIGFCVAAVLALVPGIETNSGLLVVMGTMTLAGAAVLWVGLSIPDTAISRLGLTILSGIVAAGIIVVVDTATKTLTSAFR